MSNLRREKTSRSAFHHPLRMVCAPLPCYQRGKLAFIEGFPLLIFSITGDPSLSLGLGLCFLCLTWAFSFLRRDGWTQQACCQHPVPLLSGSVTSTGVLSGGSAVFSVGIQSLQNLSKMSKRDVKCLTAVFNDTLLADCGASAGRCLNLQNGSLVLRSVEKEDEGKYEFVFHNTTRFFTLKVFGKWLS